MKVNPQYFYIHGHKNKYAFIGKTSFLGTVPWPGKNKYSLDARFEFRKRPCMFALMIFLLTA